MNCHQLDTTLDDHAVGSLSAAQRSEMEAHLATCARCSTAWLGHRVLAGDSAGEPRPELFGEIAAYVAAARPPTATRRFASWLGVAAAALVVAVLASSYLFRYATIPEPADAGRGPVGQTANSGAAGSREALHLVAGQDYRVLPTPVPTLAGANKIEVSEFFMFECRPCFSFEAALEAWRARQPGYVELVRVPAIFKPTAMLHAQAFYTAEALGKLDEMRMPFYEEIHVRGNPLASEAAVRTFFARFGVDGKTFDEAFDSPGVRAKLRYAVELNRQYGVSATPSIGVNGRYVTDPSMAASHGLLDVVDALVQAEVSDSRAAKSGASAVASASPGASAAAVEDKPTATDYAPVAAQDDDIARTAKKVFDAFDRGVTPTFVDYLAKKGLSREDSEKIVADAVRDMTTCVVNAMRAQASTSAAPFKIEAGNPPAALPALFFSDRAGACISGVEQRIGLPPNVTFEMSAQGSTFEFAAHLPE